MVKTGRTSRSDVHTRALADGLEAFEDLDVLGPVRVSGL
jgi:hypothetical protein